MIDGHHSEGSRLVGVLGPIYEIYQCDFRGPPGHGRQPAIGHEQTVEDFTP
jgi:hypothetical protein